VISHHVEVAQIEIRLEGMDVAVDQKLLAPMREVADLVGMDVDSANRVGTVFSGGCAITRTLERKAGSTHFP